MAAELNKDENWVHEQIETFNRVAKGFIVKR